ncbi:MAG: mercuric transporter MerT family protein [Robiginitomaculum sp.]|nr:mercuric transporter MerT family protein [Robiginitomaculum sp.]
MSPKETPLITPTPSPWLATGGIVGAIIASSCCVVPLVLVMLGLSGAWVSNLTALEPYKPIFLLITAGLIGTGFWQVYRPAKPDCERAVCVPSRRRAGSPKPFYGWPRCWLCWRPV